MIQIRKRENAYKWVSVILLTVIVFMAVLIANGVNAQAIGGFFDSKVISSTITGDNYVIASSTSGSQVLIIGKNDIITPTTTGAPSAPLSNSSKAAAYLMPLAFLITGIIAVTLEFKSGANAITIIATILFFVVFFYLLAPITAIVSNL